jgi:hypothetical protein
MRIRRPGLLRTSGERLVKTSEWGALDLLPEQSLKSEIGFLLDLFLGEVFGVRSRTGLNAPRASTN